MYYLFAPSFFSKKISKKQNIASTKISYQFLAPKVSALTKKKKPPTPVLLTIHSQLQWKPLHLGIYSGFLDLPSHSHGQFAYGYDE